jgi:phospholipase C
VSFVDPRFIDEGSGTSGDDHPHADIRNGEAFLNLIYTAITRSPAWSKTVLVFNYDEWGGFFEHVPPPTAPIPPADALAGNADGRLGFRVPCMIVAPFARRKYIDHQVYDHTSVLKLIEWRWGLAPLTVRDQTAANLAQALDFGRPKLGAPLFDVPFGPFGTPCPPTIVASREEQEWLQLRALAQQQGWQLP